MESNRNKRYAEESDKEEARTGYNAPARKKPRHEVVSYHFFARNFYVPHASVLRRSEDDNNDLQSALALTTVGENVPGMVQSLDETNLPLTVKLALKYLRLDHVTSVQGQGWPIILSGRYMLGIGHSGCGKSMAFAVPALIHIKNQRFIRQPVRPIALICAPSSIHAEQLEIVFRKMVALSRIGLRCKHIRNATSIAGDFRYDIVLGTAPILSSFVRLNVTVAQRFTFVVIDEIDRMLALRQEVNIRQMLQTIRTDWQLVMWTTICSAEVHAIADEFLNSEHIRLTVSLSPPNPMACMDLLSLELRLRRLFIESKRSALVKRQIRLVLNRLRTLQNSSHEITFSQAMRESSDFAMNTTHSDRNVLRRLEMAYNALEFEHERFFGENIFSLEYEMAMERMRTRQQQQVSDNQ